MASGSPDILVVGGGAAGMMAAISAASRGRRVALLEGGERLGRKILISGNGRCNLTNVEGDQPRHYHGQQSAFVRPALKGLPVAATLEFFRRLGVEARQETRGRLFPQSDQARSVVAVLEDRLAQLGVQVHLGTRVEEVRRTDAGFVLRAGGATWHCRRLVMATGGPSAPKLGADRSGIDLVCGLGHTCSPLAPGLVPLVSPDPFVHRMQGARLEAEVSAPLGARRRAVDHGDVLFTPYGLSGLAVLNLSARLVPYLRGDPVPVTLDLFPGRTPESLSEMLRQRWQDNRHRSLADSFWGLLPDRVATPLVEALGLPPGQRVADVGKAQRWQLAQGLHAWPVPVTQPRPLDYAEVTIGGIRTRHLDPETLASRLVPGLFMAGEMLDIHGDLGGFNFQWAWSGGWLAGQAAGT